MKRLIAFLIFILTRSGLAIETQISLTSSEGTGLEFRQLEAKVVLDGFLAFTELQMVFYNPEARQREGQFQMILPDNATISRFAMKINEQLQEGEIVEKQQARQVYEDFLHRRQDPALLEVDSGNRFNARVFPIEAHAEKLLILSYSQRLDKDFSLPLKGLPLLKQLSIKVFYDSQSFGPVQHTQVGHLTGTLSKREILTFEKQNYQPTEDFRMPYQPKSPLSTTAVVKGMAMQSEQWVAARIFPFSDSVSTTQGFDQLVILVDVSASQAPFLTETIKQLASLLPQLKVNILHLYTFDQGVQEIGTALGSEEQVTLVKKLDNIDALGASRIDKTLGTLTTLKLEKARLLIISDAVITAGDSSPEQFKKLPWLERLDLIIPSYHNDKYFAHQLVQTGKSVGMVTTLHDSGLLDKLTHTVYSGIPVKVSDANWYWPEKIDTLHHNEPFFVFAELKEKQSFSISVGDKPIPVTMQPANPLLLKRELAKARIDKLLELEANTQDQDMNDAFRREILHLSVSERVLSPYTSLLVLETEEDYRRYHIDRRSLTDILTIGIEGITVVKRSGIESPPSPPVVEVPVPMMGEKLTVKNGDEAKVLEAPLSKARENGDEQEKTTDRKQNSPSAPKNGKGPSEVEVQNSVTFSKPVPFKKEEPNDGRKKGEHKDLDSIEAPKTVDVPHRDLSSEKPGTHAGNSTSSRSQTSQTPTDSSPEQSLNGGADGLSLKAPTLPNAPKEEIDETTQKSVASDRPVPHVSQSESPPVPTGQTSSDKAESKPEAGKSFEVQQPASSETRESEESNESQNEAESTSSSGEENEDSRPSSTSPWVGKYAEFKIMMEKKEDKAVGQFIKQWRQEDLSDLMALIALGEWYEKTGEVLQAARAYGSLIDYFPTRVDIRRWAGERLLKLDGELSVDTFKKAVEQRPDHPTGHYLLAIAYWEIGRYKEAVETLKKAMKIGFNDESIKRIFEETQAIMLTRLEQTHQLKEFFPHETFERVTQHQLRFVLTWETDANDVDFHIYDAQQHHAYYSSPTLPTGGTLYADITTGYGPECFQIINPTAFPYRLQAHYYNRGPMGYGMGRVHILEYIPNQMLKTELRPFIVMQDGAFLDLGKVPEQKKGTKIK